MNKKEAGRRKRHGRIRKKIFGTAERPRLSVRRSLRNLYVQVINDVEGKTLISFSTADASFLKSAGKKSKTESSKSLGSFFAKNMKDKGIQRIAFDRGGYQYHGRVKALAESLREAGIEF